MTQGMERMVWLCWQFSWVILHQSCALCGAEGRLLEASPSCGIEATALGSMENPLVIGLAMGLRTSCLFCKYVCVFMHIHRGERWSCVCCRWDVDKGSLATDAQTEMNSCMFLQLCMQGHCGTACRTGVCHVLGGI